MTECPKCKIDLIHDSQYLDGDFWNCGLCEKQYFIRNPNYDPKDLEDTLMVLKQELAERRLMKLTDAQLQEIIKTYTQVLNKGK